jgi:hypothetical protein
MLLADLDADALAAELSRCDQRRTGTGERVKHRAACWAEGFNEWLERGEGPLRRVQLVPGIGKFDHIGDRLRW